jgi:hypothetical protein
VTEPSGTTQPRIVDFLRSVGEDSEKLRAFNRDPDRVLASANLTAEQRDVLRSGDLVRIRDAIRREENIPPEHFFLVVVWLTMSKAEKTAVRLLRRLRL